MKIIDLKILAVGFGIIFTLSVAASLHFWTLPHPELAARRVLNWQPTEDFNPVGFSDDGSQTLLDQALARPVFRHSRKPFDSTQARPSVEPPLAEPVAIAQPLAPPLDTSQISVKGVFLAGSVTRALVATPEFPDGNWLSVGSEIMGWTIIKLNGNGVILSAGPQTAEIKLYVDNKTN